MNILDEDISNFNKDASRYRHYADIIQDIEPNLHILVSNCQGVPCSECIGHKYSLYNGCPVCGSDITLTMGSSLHRCKKCGSVIVAHISCDIVAIGVQKIWLELITKDDII